MTRHTDEVRADGRLAYPELAARDTVTDGHRILELKPLVHPSGMPAAATPVWISEEIPGVIVRLSRLGLGAEQYRGSCYFAVLGPIRQINTCADDLPTVLGRLSGYLSDQLGTPITATLRDPHVELELQRPTGSCHYCGTVRGISSVRKISTTNRVETVFECDDLERCRCRRSALADLPYNTGLVTDYHGQEAPSVTSTSGRPPRTFADALKIIGRRLIGGDPAGPDVDISDTDYVVFPNAGINLDQLFPDDPPAERPNLAGQADVAAELDHAMRRPGIAAGPGIAANPGPFVRVGLEDRTPWSDNPKITLGEYLADPPTRNTRTHFTGTYVTPPPPELSPEELSSELGAIMDLMAPVRLLRDLCSGEDEHRLDVFDSFLRDLATRVTEIAAALHDAADR